jgi:hypothetical protein
LILVTALVITSYQRQARLPARPTAPPRPAGPAAPGDTGRTIMVDAPATGSAVEPIIVRTTPLVPPPELPKLDAVPHVEPAPPTAPVAQPKSEHVVANAGTPAKQGSASVFDLQPPDDPRAERAVPPDDPPVARVVPPDDPLAAQVAPQREVPAGSPLKPPAPLRSAWGDPLAPDSPELAFRVVAAPDPGPVDRPQEPRPTPEQIFQSIQAEAQQKQAEQKNLEREVALSKFRGMAEMIQRTQAERIQFHEDLRRVLSELGNNAGPEIKALCERYGRDMPAEVERAATVRLNRLAAGVKRERRIALMRVHGFPEAMILDDLAKELDPTRGTRGGPRNHNEVRVFAARILLKYPPPAPRAAPGEATTVTNPAAVARTPAPPAQPSVRPTQ